MKSLYFILVNEMDENNNFYKILMKQNLIENSPFREERNWKINDDFGQKK